MFEFEIIEEIKPSDEILKIIKNCTFTIKNGKVRHLLKANLQFIEPIEYAIAYSIGFIYKEAITEEELYDKKEMFKHFDLLLKEINIEYRTTLVNFVNYYLIMFAMAKIMEMDSFEQNKVAIYLFNSIYSKIKKYVNDDKILDNYEQVF
ncbi:MAG: hypothetical protein J6A89_08625 [Clostridia bacterium]|nr:hypothetical protein [Clostridia bacterium]